MVFTLARRWELLVEWSTTIALSNLRCIVTYILFCIGLVACVPAVCISVVYYSAIWRFRHPAFPSGGLIEWREVIIHLRKGEGTLVVIEGISPGKQYLWCSQRLPQSVTVMELYADDSLPCAATLPSLVYYTWPGMIQRAFPSAYILRLWEAGFS